MVTMIPAYFLTVSTSCCCWATPACCFVFFVFGADDPAASSPLPPPGAPVAIVSSGTLFANAFTAKPANEPASRGQVLLLVPFVSQQ